MKGIFEFLAALVKIVLIVIKGDQPKRTEVEEATNDLEKQNSHLQKDLEKKINDNGR